MFINRLSLWCFRMHKLLKNREDCLNCLTELQITYKLHEHEPAFTMQDLASVKLENSPLIKNLLYTDRKSGAYFMVIAENNTVINKTFLKTLGKNIKFADLEKVEEILLAKKGSVNPFSLVNDQEKAVNKLVIDEKLYGFESWSFHPMDNAATIEVSQQGVLKFLQHFQISCEKANLTFVPEKQTVPKDEKPKKQEGNTLGMEYKRKENFSLWYSEVISKSGMLDYYDVSGCYILRPWAFGIWERTSKFFDDLIKDRGVENAYFPMFVSKKSLETEKEHVEGFAAEVAWVTKSGKSDLAEPIAIRPTSETIMYPAYANWIRSHRDLPLKLNQWTNIVRWEFKHPTPFIRTREFLWQEGHTAHATFEEAEQETLAVLDLYRRVYEEVLAVPVHKGVKSESQKFAGGLKTTTIETWIPENGRSIQAATSHNLGQNFAKMFGIEFEDQKKEKQLVWQTSWGITTRSIGILVMHHGDDKGLVLPPRVANIQVVIIPIIIKNKEELVAKAADHIFTAIKSAKIRVHVDDRDNYTPGWKYNHWELKGVPIRVEIGPKDVAAEKVQCVLRYNGEKFDLKWTEIQEKLPQILEQVQNAMYQRAKQKLDSLTKEATTWDQFMNLLNDRNVVLTPWCQTVQCEEKVKLRSGKESKELATEEGDTQLTGQAKTLCMPLDCKPLSEGEKCFHCDQAANTRVYWGRSY